MTHELLEVEARMRFNGSYVGAPVIIRLPDLPDPRVELQAVEVARARNEVEDLKSQLRQARRRPWLLRLLGLA